MLENEASKHGTEWSWKTHPADSLHRNGAAEAAVRTVKQALHNLGGCGFAANGLKSMPQKKMGSSSKSLFHVLAVRFTDLLPYFIIYVSVFQPCIFVRF